VEEVTRGAARDSEIDSVFFSASGLTLTTNSAGQPIWNSPTYGLITAANQSRFLQLAGRFDF
jgi:hypothetical protein